MFEQAISSDQAQVFQQMTDIALLEAAHIVSSLGHLEVQINAISLGYDDQQKMAKLFEKTTTELVAVSQALEGDVSGHAIFLMNEDSTMTLVRELLNETVLLRELTEMEEEALSEVGNIIINSCLSNYMQLIKGKVGSQLPMITRGHISQLLKSYVGEIKPLPMFNIELSIQTRHNHYSGYLLLTQLPWLDHL